MLTNILFMISTVNPLGCELNILSCCGFRLIINRLVRCNILILRSLVAGTNNLQQQHKPPQFHESDVITDASFASANINSKCKGNSASSKSRIANETTPIHMNSNNSSIISSRTTNNQQLAPGAPSNQVYNQQQQNISQYGNNNNYSNQNNLNNNFNMVAAGQQSGLDVGYNSQVRS